MRKRLRPPVEGVLSTEGLITRAGLRVGPITPRDGLLSLPVRSFIDGVDGLVDWWKSGVGLATSGAGPYVDSWTGDVNGVALTSSGASRPTLDTFDTLSSPHWVASGSPQHLDLIGWSPPNFDHSITLAAYTVIAVSGGISSSVDGAALQNGNFFDAPGEFYLWVPWASTKLLPEPVIPPGSVFFGSRSVITYVCGRTYAALWLNGVKVQEATYAAAAVTTPDDFYLGWLYGLGNLYDFLGSMHDAVLVNGISADSDYEGIHAQLMALREV